MTFWIVITFMALAIAALIALVLIRAQAAGEPAAAYDLRVYQQQLREIEKDLARGLINETDANRIRTEISRRILTADAQLQAHQSGKGQPRTVTHVFAILSAMVLIGGSLALYSHMGAPGYGDLALETRLASSMQRADERPTQAEAEAHRPAQPTVQVDEGYAQLVEQLRTTASERADDAQGQALLAQHEAVLGNFIAAYQAKQNFIRIMSGDVEARDHGEAAELMIMAAGGYVSPEAEEELRSALTLDRAHGPSRYYWGVMLNQIDRPDLAYQIWSETLQMGPAGASWIEGIQEQIEEMAYRAGVNYTPITPGGAPAQPLAGPSAEDLANAEEMSSQDRQQMIRGMVEGLSDRLAAEGGTAQEWARLIGALGVLGETERAGLIHQEALQRFASDAAALELIAGAAQQAGLTQ